MGANAKRRTRANNCYVHSAHHDIAGIASCYNYNLSPPTNVGRIPRIKIDIARVEELVYGSFSWWACMENE